MSEPDNAEERRRWILSALADGEAVSSEQEPAFRAWRDDASARATWHAYHLIGDVLRSDDLAHRPGRDAALLQAVRQRLAAEPVVLAPPVMDDDAQERALAHGGAPALPAAAAAGGSRRAAGWARAHWQGPAAMAAGFVIVAGGLMLRTGHDGRGASPEALASATPAASQAGTVTASSEQLGPYLAAHRQWGGTAPIQMPDAGLRSVSLTQTLH